MEKEALLRQANSEKDAKLTEFSLLFKVYNKTSRRE